MVQRNPKVSVIIPVYNTERYLRECLDSVVNQTLKDIEIICVDGGSTDGSLAILREYEAKDSRVNVLTQKNQFAGVARNHGMEEARGKYYAFLEAYDSFLPDALETMYTKCELYMLEVLKASFYIVEYGKEPYDTPYSTNSRIPASRFGELLSFENKSTDMIHIADEPWSGLYRASFIRKYSVRFNNLQEFNDHSFFVSCIINARRLMVIDHHVVNHKEKESSSLVETRYKCFESQIDSYYVVKDITLELPPKQRQIVMQHELISLLGWYNRLRSIAPAPYDQELDKVLRAFVVSFDVNDVGTKCLFTMPDSELFYRTKSEILYDQVSKCNVETSESGTPKVSVIIPIYNDEQHLRECLSNVQSQTLKDIEIICIDDGSTDGSLEILRTYESADNRFVVISKPNEGAGPTRTLGIQKAHGEYVAFMDGDDYYPETTTLEKLYFAAKKQNALICGGSLCVVKDGVRKTDFGSGRNWGYTIPCDALMLYRDYQFDFGYHRFLYKHQFLIDNEIIFPSYRRFQDPPFFARAMATAGQFYAIKDLTYCYRESVNFNNVVKDERKCCDVLLGYADVLDTAKANQLHELYALEMERVFDGGWTFVEAAKQLQIPISENALNRLADAFDPSFWRPDLNVDTNGVKKLEAARAFVLAEKNGKKEHKTCVLPDKESVQYSKQHLETKPIVSVIVSVFNMEPYLADCLDSIVEQTLKDIEIICVNDGSTDGSLPILEEYQKKDPRIIIVNRPNGGLSAARNSGMRYARGEYIYFIDSDDLLEFNALEKASQIAIEENLDIILFERRMFFDSEKMAKNSPFKIKHIKERTEIMSGIQYIKASKEQGTYIMTACFALWRRTFLEEHNITFKEGIIHEDNLFSFQAYMAAGRVMRIPDKFYLRRLREDSIMTRPISAQNVIGYFTCALGVLELALSNGDDPLKEQIITQEYNRMLSGAQRNYKSISAEERIKIVFAREIENQLFKQLVTSENEKIKKHPAPATAHHESPASHDKQGITWLPRKLRGGIQCYRDHGFAHTFRRTLYHMGLWEDEANPDCNNRPLLKRFADCYSDHGLPHTAWRVLVYLHMAKDTEEPALLQRLEAAVPAQKKPAKAAAPAQKKPAEAAAPAQKESAKTAEPIKKDYAYYSSLSPDKYPEELKLRYKRFMKEDLDLDNPKTYNEKIQWMKLYDSTPLKTRLTDKYLVRDWVREKIGEEYLIPLLGVWDSFDEIDFDKLPEQFALKANHGCGWNIIVKDKSTFDKEEARKKFDVWMHTNFAFCAGLELHYMNIPPKIIAEQYLENNNADLYDYKVFCFNGKAESIMFLSDRKQGLKMSFYDLQWKKLPFVYSYPQNPDEISKPENLELMISLAEKLAEGFPHVRVDFYILNDGSIKFGEMTFSSASGTCKWTIPEQDRIYGDLIKLPPKSPIPTRQRQ